MTVEERLKLMLGEQQFQIAVLSTQLESALTKIPKESTDEK